MNRTDRSIKKLEIINQWISNVDTKSSFVLTFYGVIITIIFTSNLGLEMINTFSYARTQEINVESAKLFISLAGVIIFFIAVVITLYNIYQSLKGRINSSVYKQANLNTNSNIFFETIASKSFSDFEQQTNNERKRSFLNDLNSQIFINSNIVDKKFIHYNRSLKWIIISFTAFLLFILTK